MLVLGIDPGTATTGYGLVRQLEDGSLQAVAHGAILTPANTPMPQRLDKLYTELQEILRLHRPESAAVEKLFFSKNVKTALSVGQGRGVVLLALAQSKLPIGEYTPNEIKQAVTGYGNAGKSQVQEMVKLLLGLDARPTPDDAADALAVAVCHLHHSRYQALMEE
ncbi:MAG: crossover junction endodeoxyribonuclease RuvC [Anaerolineales bacterium]|nr:crossover junction endodeoxyribonuclease RuvC [Anaerolineales bacterium]